MWLYLLVGLLVVLGIVGGILGGGIFTIVLLPLALVVVASAVITGMVARSHERKAAGSTDATPTTGRPLPHDSSPSTGRVPTSPEGLVDARREQQ
ncbi:MAG: hypothetical protein JO181_03760 [Solirubrobacterales bacterium]|nr:hypothetical protein [Solirubrobacterales bacterium]